MSAFSASPRSQSSTASREKAEKVVNPPRMPVRQKQPQVLPAARVFQCEEAGEKPHEQSTNDIHNKRSDRVERAEQAERSEVDEMPAAGADRTTQGHKSEMDHRRRGYPPRLPGSSAQPIPERIR